ncbi:protein ACTIVITY OF BC1 COMPLEX KINASE 7, chloroplastic [Iris pallida]|uniref:Protein ACTIVITY OF BC1 COMPLEX KINASE 7, chloroplastic n=1 Tax=Iris pallida TaxID=29817 RepID=A0AAX6DT93_IRIPA|nr:protein ACTIVITY OF BC1 COMPLEX KINASE 7, chloroplastic [Iris pallida]
MSAVLACHGSSAAAISRTASPKGPRCCATGPTVRSVAESEKIGSNGRAVRMVPTEEVMRNMRVNGTTSIVKRGGSPKPAALVPVRRRTGGLEELPPLPEDLKALPSDEGFSWTKENYNGWKRTIDIWAFVLSFRVKLMFDNATWAYPGGFTEEKQKSRRKKTATWLREQILQLGPTFIKLGQMSSTRSDLFPKEFVDELAQLQDRVPAFSAENARAFIQKELGASVDILFKKFEDRPIAAASLGQVHRAILHNGEKVVVKVQRPGLKKLFDIDLRNLKLIAEYFQRSETFGGGSTTDWIGVYHECSKILYEETDYINEGKNADRFRRDYRNIKWVRIPLINWDYTSMKILTMEYVPGIKINSLDQIDARGFSRSQIASRTIESYLIQILKTGFFHADPHPGNLALDTDGSLIYYDFGMMGEITPSTREKLLELFYSVYEKDVNKILRCLIDLKALQPTGDMTSVRRSVKFFLDSLSNQTDQEQTLAAIGEDLFAIAMDQPIRFPAAFAFLMRAFSTLEGISYTLNPEFSFMNVAAPYAQELIESRQKLRGGTELVEEIRKQANDARNSTISMPNRIQKIEEFVKQLESGDLKLRVRVLESERAARKASILQMASMYTALSGALLNIGVTLIAQGSQVIANGSFVGAGVFFILLIRSMQKVKTLEKIEKII